MVQGPHARSVLEAAVNWNKFFHEGGWILIVLSIAIICVVSALVF